MTDKLGARDIHVPKKLSFDVGALPFLMGHWSLKNEDLSVRNIYVFVEKLALSSLLSYSVMMSRCKMTSSSAFEKSYNYGTRFSLETLQSQPGEEGRFGFPKTLFYGK